MSFLTCAYQFFSSPIGKKLKKKKLNLEMSFSTIIIVEPKLKNIIEKKGFLLMNDTKIHFLDFLIYCIKC